MPLYYLALIALVQGITEFLPISSSAHLVILPRLAGETDQGLVIDVAVHIGTLLAVLLYFRKDIFGIVRAYTIGIKSNADDMRAARRLGAMVVIGSIPLVIAGFLLHLALPEGIRSVAAIAVTTIVFGLLLWWADKKSTLDRCLESMTVKEALVIGATQILALVPGTSRSGITMTAGLFYGFKRTETARFSLLLGIPAILGAGTLSMMDVIEARDYALGRDALIGMGLSFMAAYVTLVVMMRWLSFSSFMPFVIYRLLLGIALLFMIMM